MDIFIPILKADDTRHEIFGMLAAEEPDKAGEVFDYDSSKPYVKAWSDDAVAKTLTSGQEISYGNVRVQHNPKAVAGKLVDLQFDDKNRRIPIIAKVTDPAIWDQVLQGVFTGFSLGGRYIKKWVDGSHVRYTAQPNEVSLVDSPAMPGARFSLVKSSGAVEQRSFHTTDLHAITERIAVLAKSLDQRPRQIDPNNLDTELRKSLAQPKTPAEIEEAMAQSPRFQPKHNKVNWGDSAPWL